MVNPVPHSDDFLSENVQRLHFATAFREIAIAFCEKLLWPSRPSFECKPCYNSNMKTFRRHMFTGEQFQLHAVVHFTT